MLKMEHVSIAYDAQDKVVNDFNLEMKKGEIVSIVGESGSGKTTVIRSIMGALAAGGKITEGRISFGDEDITSYRASKWRELRGTKMSMIFQDCGGSLNPIRKIGKQYIEYIRTHDSCSKAAARKKAIEMLGKMHLSDPENIMNSYPFQLSGGMRQRVGIALAMTFRPQLLLADEPTGALDLTTQAQIVREMIALRDRYQTGIIIVTHNLGVAAHMADQLIVMKDGRVMDRGTADTVLKHPTSEYTVNLLQAVPQLGGDFLA